MVQVLGPAVAISATGEQLAMGPSGPSGPPGPGGATGPSGPSGPAGANLNEAFAPLIAGTVVTDGDSGVVAVVTLTPNTSGVVEVIANVGPGVASMPSSAQMYIACSLHNVAPTNVMNAIAMNVSMEEIGTGIVGLVSGLMINTAYDFSVVVEPTGDNMPMGSPAVSGGIYA